MRSAPATALAVALSLTACSEVGFRPPARPPPADPPDRPLDLWGTPPSDWQGCFPGFRGLYYNLSGHPDVERPLSERPEPADGEPALALPDDLDWWDGPLSFERYDPSADFGPSWWPVDESFSDDPLYYAVRWIGWVRVTRRGDHDIVLGAATDAWVLLNGDVVASTVDQDAFEPEARTLNLNTGVYRLDVRFAHRLGSASGFRLRFAREGLLTCFPEYGDPIRD
jgi:hypothetical protein